MGHIQGANIEMNTNWEIMYPRWFAVQVIVEPSTQLSLSHLDEGVIAKTTVIVNGFDAEMAHNRARTLIPGAVIKKSEEVAFGISSLLSQMGANFE